MSSSSQYAANSQCANKYTHRHFKALSASVLNVSGAGDCLVAGSLAGLLDGKPAEYAIKVGLAAACRAVESSYNVPKKMTFLSVAHEARRAEGESIWG